MAFLHAFSVGDFVDTLVSLLAAFVLGTLIGAERQYRGRGGGLRTHTLVAVGAATFGQRHMSQRGCRWRLWPYWETGGSCAYIPRRHAFTAMHHAVLLLPGRRPSAASYWPLTNQIKEPPPLRSRPS
jgi:hypothetical protein